MYAPPSFDPSDRLAMRRISGMRGLSDAQQTEPAQPDASTRLNDLSTLLGIVASLALLLRQ